MRGRLKYIYIHPEGVEEPNLSLKFKKADETAISKNKHELIKVHNCNQNTYNL